jgi:lia operon protein LiaG
LGDFSGEGSFDQSSGNIRLDLRELSGDMRFNVSSGDINVSVPRELSFNLDAVTSSGSVLVTEGGDEAIRVSGSSSVFRPIGPSPEFTIYARTRSGSVNIRRGL